MPLLGKVELKANKDVKAGDETTLSELFTFDERRKELTLEADVERDKTKLKVTVEKLGSFETTADTTRKKGEKTNLWMLLKVADFTKKIKSAQEIKKGDALSITVETV